PLHFLSNLRERFIETLDLGSEDIIFPENSQLYVAIGAAIASAEQKDMPFLQLRTTLDNPNEDVEEVTEHLPPLFKDEEEYNAFKKRHDQHTISTNNLEGYQGDTFLGVDAGSTTTKVVLLSEDNEILYSFYGNNKGKPLEQSIEILKDIYSKLGDNKITRSCVTGYGEDFIKAALNIDEG